MNPVLTPQTMVTIIAGFCAIAIPFSALWLAFKRTPKHGFACPACDADVPAGKARCQNCGAPIPDHEQLN